jgi:hypothetical protein
MSICSGQFTPLNLQYNTLLEEHWKNRLHKFNCRMTVWHQVQRWNRISSSVCQLYPCLHQLFWFINGQDNVNIGNWQMYSMPGMKYLIRMLLFFLPVFYHLFAPLSYQCELQTRTQGLAVGWASIYTFSLYPVSSATRQPSKRNRSNQCGLDACKQANTHTLDYHAIRCLLIWAFSLICLCCKKIIVYHYYQRDAICANRVLA